eukprot:jgi/Galph1/823/GphlegSOOS_G5494.1
MSRAETYINECANKDPAYEKLAELYRRKLWHQLTSEILNFITDSGAGERDLVAFYDNFIQEFESYLNPLALVRVVVSISRKQFKESKLALEFLQRATNAKTFITANQEAYLFLNSETADLKLREGDISRVKEILEQIQTVVDYTPDLDAVVHSSYHRVCAQYYKIVGPATKYYSSALLFFTYTSPLSLSVEERIGWAYDLGISALVGETIFNYGEILEYEIMQSLNDDSHRWLLELLFAFKLGSIDKFNQVHTQLREKLLNEPVLSSNFEYLEQKNTFACFDGTCHDLQNVWFPSTIFVYFVKLPKIRYFKLSQWTHVLTDNFQVEQLLMKALSLHLIEGTIDEIQKIITISYVQPKTLDKNEVQHLYDRLIPWKASIHQITLSLERNTQTMQSQQ